MVTVQAVLPCQPARLIPELDCLLGLTPGVVQTGLMMQYPGQGCAVHHLQRGCLGLGQLLARCLEFALLHLDQRLANVEEQVVEGVGSGCRVVLQHAHQASVSLQGIAASKVDLGQQQVQVVGVAAEGELGQLFQCLMGRLLGAIQIAERQQAAGAVVEQHSAGGATLGPVPHAAVGQTQTMPVVAAQYGKSAAQKGNGLEQTLGAIGGYLRLTHQALQEQQAVARTLDIIGGDYGARFGDRQCQVIGVTVGQVHQEVDDGVDLALAQQVKTVLFDLGQQAVVIAAAPQLVDRLAIAAMLQQPVGSLQMQSTQ